MGKNYVEEEAREAQKPLLDNFNEGAFDALEVEESSEVQVDYCFNPCTYVLAGICYLLDACGCF